MGLSKLFLALLFIGQFSLAQDQLVLPRISSKDEVIIGQSVAVALSTVTSDFRVLEKKHFSKTSIEYGLNHPMAAVGDFNKDGYRDIVLIGYSRSKRTYYVSGFLSDNDRSSYVSNVLMSYDINKFTFKENPMYLKTISQIGTKKLPRDFIQIETYGHGGASAHSFYYSLKDKKFKIYRGTVD